MQSLLSAVSGAHGYTVNVAGPGSLVLTRKYTPTWAVVLGIIGLLVFLLGVLFFLVKTTETVTVGLREVPGGTEVRASGVATPELQARFNVVFGGAELPSPQKEDVAPPSPHHPSPTSTPMAPAPEEAQPVEKRLARLDQMKSDGLITDEEYGQQRARLLESI